MFIKCSTVYNLKFTFSNYKSCRSSQIVHRVSFPTTPIYYNRWWLTIPSLLRLRLRLLRTGCFIYWWYLLKSQRIYRHCWRCWPNKFFLRRARKWGSWFRWCWIGMCWVRRSCWGYWRYISWCCCMGNKVIKVKGRRMVVVIVKRWLRLLWRLVKDWVVRVWVRLSGRCWRRCFWRGNVGWIWVSFCMWVGGIIRWRRWYMISVNRWRVGREMGRRSWDRRRGNRLRSWRGRLGGVCSWLRMSMLRIVTRNDFVLNIGYRNIETILKHWKDFVF